MPEVKFTEEELKQIGEFRQKYVDIQMGFGQLEINKMRLHQQLSGAEDTVNSLRESFQTVQTTEREFIQQINDKYGDGVLDPATGVFTPSEEPQEAATDSEKK
jgi:phosphopantetheine adenylyltransferase